MTQSYFDDKAEIWDDKIAEKDTDKLEKIANNLDIKPGSNILDVGTGTGIFVPFLLKKIGSKGKLVCLDSAEKMLEKAKAKDFKGNIEFICSDIHHTDFQDEIFDAVVCYSSFPHFRDKSRALREIMRLLKKGGRLFICHTSSRITINEIHKQIPGLSTDLIPEEEEMLGLLSSAGFVGIELHDDASSYFARADKF